MDLLQREMGIWGIRKFGRKTSHEEDTQRGQQCIIFGYMEHGDISKELIAFCPDPEPFLSLSQFSESELSSGRLGGR